MTTAQANALDELFKIAVYTENASAAYAAFRTAFGLSGGSTAQYTVTYALSNATSSNSAASAAAGASYSATISAADGYAIEIVTVTMGGVDITATAYTGGVITINNVTGNIVITAVAKASSGANLVTDGLQGFFDFRTAEYDNDGTGGKTTITAMQGTGVLFAWAKNGISQQGAKGLTMSNARSYMYDPAGGTNAADYSGAMTITTLGYADVAVMGYNAKNISPFWAYRPQYKTTTATGMATEKAGNSSKAGYCYCVYRVDGNDLKLVMNDEETTYTGEDIDGFAQWDATVKIGLARQTDAGMSIVAAAIYNRALTDVELTEMRAYMQTMEVSE